MLDSVNAWIAEMGLGQHVPAQQPAAAQEQQQRSVQPPPLASEEQRRQRLPAEEEEVQPPQPAQQRWQWPVQQPTQGGAQSPQQWWQRQQPTQQRGPTEGANGSPHGSKGPLLAKASDLLAGLPVQQMLEREQARKRLQRQQGLQNGSAGPPSAPTAAWRTPVASSSSSSSEEEDAGGSGQAAWVSTVDSPEAALALSFYRDTIRRHRLVPVLFRLTYAAQQGQHVKVVGGHESLGAWAAEDAPKLSPCKGGVWEARVPLPAGAVTEYSYIVCSDSGAVLAMQRGNNAVLTIRMDDRALEVVDAWGGASAGGGLVVAQGEAGPAAAASRESRLMAWASDMFRQVAALKGDLRRSRMEMVGLKEEVREARLEARRVALELQAKQAQLEQMEHVAAVAKAQLAAANSLNRTLQTRLVQTLASLQDAIATAADLLADRQRLEEEAWQRRGWRKREKKKGQGREA